MSRQRAPWITRNEAMTKAECHRCGGMSIYMFLSHWFVNGRHFTKWKWWREFKRTHKKCVERKTNESN